jgi:peptidoglycan hydrolase-like protein with peptidoglycan-binding domain
MRARILAVSAFLLVALALAAPAGAAVNPQNAGLQVALRAWGIYFGRIDGIAGPQTARAVRVFQRRKGLSVDGIPGPSTRRALGRLGRPLYGRRQLRRGMVGWDVSVLQFMLTKRGAPTGIIDGYFGHETARALRRFQARAGLSADGVAGSRTRRALQKRVRRSSGGSPSTVKAKLNYWASNYGMSPRFIRALAWVESGWQPNVVSSAGAFGVMQVTPATWEFVQTVLVGHPIPRTVDGNIQVGVIYVRHMYREFNGNVRLTLGAYNQGPASVRRHGLYRETRQFVRAVLAHVGRV